MAALAPKYDPSARELTWHARDTAISALAYLEWASKMARDNNHSGMRAELAAARGRLADVLEDVDGAIFRLDSMLPQLPPSESELRVLDGNR